MPSESPLPLSADLIESLDLCMSNNWVTGLERPALTPSPFYLLCFVPFQVCKENVWIRHGLSSPPKLSKTVRWGWKQQTAVLSAWATDKPVSWVGQVVFTEVSELLWSHTRVQSACELFHTSWACFGCLLKLIGFWKIQIIIPSYLFKKHSEKKEALKNLTL